MKRYLWVGLASLLACASPSRTTAKAPVLHCEDQAPLEVELPFVSSAPRTVILPVTGGLCADPGRHVVLRAEVAPILEPAMQAAPVIEEVPGAEIPTAVELPPGAPATRAPPSYRISFFLGSRAPTPAELSSLRKESRAPVKAAVSGDFLAPAPFRDPATDLTRHPDGVACAAMPPELEGGIAFPDVELRAAPTEGRNEVRVEFVSSKRSAVEPVLTALEKGLSVRIGLGTTTSGATFAAYRLKLSARAPYALTEELKARQCVDAERWVDL